MLAERGIRIPALMVNAKNDPFLGSDCYPATEAENSERFHLEIPMAGGHVGFPTAMRRESWVSRRAIGFLGGG